MVGRRCPRTTVHRDVASANVSYNMKLGVSDSDGPDDVPLLLLSNEGLSQRDDGEQ